MNIHFDSENIHLLTLAVCTLYFIIIFVFDSVKHGQIVFTRDYGRIVLDGITLSTGVAIGFGLFDTKLLTVIATTPYYGTVVAMICILGPIVNVAQRYGRAID